MEDSEFKQLVRAQGQKLYRDMPWRQEPSFYYVLVSEIMLQQTQVSRVMTKFAEFTERFPTIEALAHAELAEVLQCWVGLGYNRRAKYLHLAAQQVVAHGQPKTIQELEQLPGIGAATAGAIMAYVYNQPVVYIETNIRTVYFYHYFAGHEQVSDAQLLPIIQRTLDTQHPREWYWALMDYGAWLKQQGQGQQSKSKHYIRQAPLEGSLRQMRGVLVRKLSLGEQQLSSLIQQHDGDERLEPALAGLQKDGLIEIRQGVVRLTK